MSNHNLVADGKLQFGPITKKQFYECVNSLNSFDRGAIGMLE